MERIEIDTTVNVSKSNVVFLDLLIVSPGKLAAVGKLLGGFIL